MQDLVITHLQWPALYTPTSEPVLVKGSLINLGDVPVALARVEAAPTVAMLETAVIRVMVYQDQFDKDWTLLTKGPVKLLQSLLPSLRRCNDQACAGQCPMFHPACGEEVAQVILDAWSWRWSTNDNRQVKTSQCSCVFLCRLSMKCLLCLVGMAYLLNLALSPNKGLILLLWSYGFPAKPPLPKLWITNEDMIRWWALLG